MRNSIIAVEQDQAQQSSELHQLYRMASDLGQLIAFDETPGEVVAQLLRETCNAPFDPDTTMDQIKLIASVFDGGSRTDFDIYVRSLFEVAADDAISPAIVKRARKILNRERRSGFRVMPAELLDACERARREILSVAAEIDRAIARAKPTAIAAPEPPARYVDEETFRTGMAQIHKHLATARARGAIRWRD